MLYWNSQQNDDLANQDNHPEDCQKGDFSEPCLFEFPRICLLKFGAKFGQDFGGKLILTKALDFVNRRSENGSDISW